MDRRTLTRIASALRDGRGEYIDGRYSLAETTMHAALNAVGAPERPHRIARLLGDCGAADALRHQRWLDGGVHPLGTPARAEADALRHARRARRERRLSVLRRAVADALANQAPAVRHDREGRIVGVAPACRVVVIEYRGQKFEVEHRDDDRVVVHAVHCYGDDPGAVEWPSGGDVARVLGWPGATAGDGGDWAAVYTRDAG